MKLKYNLLDVKPHGFTQKMDANHTATPTHTHGQNVRGRKGEF